MASLNSLTEIAAFSCSLPDDQRSSLQGRLLGLLDELRPYDFNGRLDGYGFSSGSHGRLYKRLKEAAGGKRRAAKPTRRRKTTADSGE